MQDLGKINFGFLSCLVSTVRLVFICFVSPGHELGETEFYQRSNVYTDYKKSISYIVSSVTSSFIHLKYIIQALITLHI